MTSSPVEAARRRLRDLVRRADKLGVARRDLATLPNARRLAASGRRGAFLWHGVLWTLLGVAAVGVAVVVRCYRGAETEADAWRQQQYQSVCTVNMPQQLVRVFRPPEDCEMCRGLRQIDKVANITQESFHQRYTAPGRPVVVTDAMLNWTAQQVFNFRFLKMIYTQFQQSPDCQLLAANSGSSNIGEDEFNTSTKPNLEPWHISWRNCDERAAAILRQHYGRPYFLPANEEEAKLEWIYLGSPGYRETMHIDVVEQPTWQAQLRGIKRWFLHPPPECYYQCESLEVTLQPGEIIVVDSTKWYHETTVISDEYSITVGAQFAIT